MGEYAEMMLDGTCCSSCGEYLGGGDGFPVMCESCCPSPAILSINDPGAKQKKNVRCTHAGCKKRFIDDNALKQHLRTFHIDKKAMEEKKTKDKKLNTIRNAAPQLLEALENITSAYGMLCHQVDENPEENKYYISAIEAIKAARGE